MKKNKKWYTLIEILVVIAIIWILAISAPSFNFNKKTWSEKRDKFLNAIVSVIDTEKLNSKAWKWVPSWTSMMNPIKSVISISSSSIIVNYYTWATAIPWPTMNTPFFWDPWYSITSLIPLNSAWNPLAGVANIDITFDNILNNTTFSTAWVILKINAWYNGDNKTIYFDRRTWKINF